MTKKRPHLKINKQLPKLRIQFSRRKLLLSVGLALLLLLVSSSFTFLRHQQLCSYAPYLASGELIHSETDLCPNIFDISQLGRVISNAVKLDINANFQLSDQVSSTSFAPKPAACEDILNPLCWVSNAPQLEQTDGYTNILVVGLDTRGGYLIKNTDTIMLISFDHRTGKLLYTSFPRDLYFDYVRPNGVRATYKINAVYAIDGIPGLNGVVEQLTQKKIHYYAYINFDVFNNVIDSIGGVDIMVDEPFDELFPCVELQPHLPCKRSSLMWGYGEFHFDAGPLHLDSGLAQVYVRSRQLTLDYGRARRQQQVIQAILSKVKNDPRPLGEKLTSYVELYNTLSANVQTNVQIKDIAGVFGLLSKISENKASIVLDDKLGGENVIIHYLGILPEVGWSIGFKDRSHRQLHAYLQNIYQNIIFYSERPKIRVIAAPESDHLDWSATLGGGLQFTEFNNAAVTEFAYAHLPGIRIYDFTKGAKKASLQELQAKLPGSRIYSATIDDVAQTEWGEEILVVVNKT